MQISAKSTHRTVTTDSFFRGNSAGHATILQNGFPQDKFPCLMWFGNDGCIRDRSSTMLMAHYWATTVICHRKEEWTLQEWTMYSKAWSTPFRNPTQSRLSIKNVFFMFHTYNVHMSDSKSVRDSDQAEILRSLCTKAKMQIYILSLKCTGNVRNNFNCSYGFSSKCGGKLLVAGS